jgi:aryl-alcohol dehydrogenase-like predicted oxidoreductase
VPTADATRAQIAIAWLLHHSAVILPIPGTSSVAHVKQNVAAAHVELWDEDVSVLDMIA